MGSCATLSWCVGKDTPASGPTVVTRRYPPTPWPVHLATQIASYHKRLPSSAAFLPYLLSARRAPPTPKMLANLPPLSCTDRCGLAARILLCSCIVLACEQL